jgi:general secretion pathway protein G
MFPRAIASGLTSVALKDMRVTIQSLSRRHGRRNAGFTLIEILLVIVIILLLAGALVVFVMPQREGAEKNTTRLLLNQVSSALDTYRLNLGHYPSEQEGGLDALLKKPTFENERQGEKWNGPYVKPGTQLDDAWGHKVRYEVVDRSVEGGKSALPYKLYSVGPDGQADTDDDIRFQTGDEEKTGTSGDQ